MKINKVLLILVLLTVCLTLFACTGKSNSEVSEPSATVTTENKETESDIMSTTVEDKPLVYPDEYYENASKRFNIGDKLTNSVGSWKRNLNILTGNNETAGNCFAITEIYVPAGQSFNFEASLTFESGRCGGLVFGVPNANNPGDAWYCVNIDKTSKNCRLFSVGCGEQGTSDNAKYMLNATELAETVFTLKVEYTSGLLTFYFNGRKVATRSENNFTGGYLGFNTYYGNISFSDISYSVGDMRLPINSLLISADGESRAVLDVSSGYIHEASLKTVNENVKIKVDIPTDVTVELNGERITKSGDITLPVFYGTKTFTITFIHSKHGSTAITLRLTTDVPDNLVYNDTYRPQYHYSPARFYTNDPNGLVYCETTGEYHLFYQYNPSGMSTGNQTWGHAVSGDLVNWRELGIAIDRDPDGGRIYSGSAVIDYNNSTGFFDSSIPEASRMVAVYTVKHTDGKNTQNIAYSLDNGYTWIKYSGNPVIKTEASHVGTGFRDPKVLWYEDKDQPSGGIWMMVVAGSTAQLFTSSDLKEWKFNSLFYDINGVRIDSECPDLFEMTFGDDKEDTFYVYSGAGRFYIVGNIEKDSEGNYRFFAGQERQTQYFYSSRAYATQSFFNDRNGRTVLISWLRDKTASQLDGKYWNGVHSLPYESFLYDDNGIYKLMLRPVSEVKSLYGNELARTEAVILDENNTLLRDVKSKEFVLDANINMLPNSSFEYRFRCGEGEYSLIRGEADSRGKVTLYVNTKNSSEIVSGKEWVFTPKLNADNSFSLWISVDNTALDIVVNDGEHTVIDLLFPDEASNGMLFKATSGTVVINSMICHEMMSIWN